MRNAGHCLLRASPALRAVALALLGGMSAGACSVADDVNAAIGEELSASTSPCGGVTLDARRDYRPRRWTDGHADLTGGSLAFAVPAEIPVTRGAAGNGRVKLVFGSESGATTTCVYRGNGAGGHGGRRYVFKKCAAGADLAEPDDDDADDGPAESLPGRGQRRLGRHVHAPCPAGRQEVRGHRRSPGAAGSRSRRRRRVHGRLVRRGHRPAAHAGRTQRCAAARRTSTTAPSPGWRATGGPAPTATSIWNASSSLRRPRARGSTRW